MIDPAEATAWLVERPGGRYGRSVGFITGGWPAQLAILHPIYRPPAADQTETDPFDDRDVRAAVAEGWQRVTWRELFTRAGWSLQPPDFPRCDNWTRCKGVAEIYDADDLSGPDEGRLDRASHNRLGQLLASYMDAGEQSRCVYYSAFLTTDDWDSPGIARAGLLADIDTAWTRTDLRTSPSNIWPDDRSWLFGTDYDSFMSVLSGPEDLIALVEADDFLETVRITWP